MFSTARKKIRWYQGAIYHVTARGNRKSNIFREAIDYEAYLRCMEEAMNYYNDCYRIICYCLMTNHVHIQIEAKEKPVNFFIGRVNNFYARNFNKKYDVLGHLFQGRYNAEIIENDKYLLEVSRYIHLNPIKAQIVTKAEEYEWSSYGMYIGEKKERIITTNKILSHFLDGNGRDMYKEFIETPPPEK